MPSVGARPWMGVSSSPRVLTRLVLGALFFCRPASFRAPGGSIDVGGSQGSGGSAAGRGGLPRTRSHTFQLLQALTVDTPHASRPTSLDIMGGRGGMSRAGSSKNNVA